MGKNSIYNRYIKRLLDFIISLIFIILLSPFMVIVIVIIKIESRGSVLFKQKRIGMFKKDFFIYKFRSMVENASQIGAAFTSVDDKRITRVGRVLRKTSLDELPQLINVLLGDMSIVGPRPDVRELARFDVPIYNKRFEVKPGITGMAQVYRRSSINFDDRCEMDARYVETVSFLLDIKLIALTVVGVLIQKGAL